jgi:hypothetical protein
MYKVLVFLRLVEVKFNYKFGPSLTNANNWTKERFDYYENLYAEIQRCKKILHNKC